MHLFSSFGGRTSARSGIASHHGSQLEMLEGRRLFTAFAGAYGFGANATGGTGGTTYHVTNLNDSGAGSFRDAVSASGRTVVFDVGGYIKALTPISVKSNITIEGDTAPGQGIGIYGGEVSFANSTNDIVRYIRFRDGTEDVNYDSSSPNGHTNGINLSDATNMIFDHVSIEFAAYNNVDAVGANNITIQNSILADPIQQQFNAHTETVGGNFTWFRNLFANSHNRNPLGKINDQFIDNVIYNYQAGYTVANTSGTFKHDIINNYFVAGPSTTSAGNAFYQMNAGQSVYASGNLLDSNKDGTLSGSTVTPSGVTTLSSQWSNTSGIPITSASSAFTWIVNSAGDNTHRDQVDTLVINQVNSKGTAGQLYTSQTQTGLGNDGYGTISGTSTAATSAVAAKSAATPFSSTPVISLTSLGGGTGHDDAGVIHLID